MRIIIIISLFFMLVSCTEENISPNESLSNGEGGIYLNVTGKILPLKVSFKNSDGKSREVYVNTLSGIVFISVKRGKWKVQKFIFKDNNELLVKTSKYSKINVKKINYLGTYTFNVKETKIIYKILNKELEAKAILKDKYPNFVNKYSYINLIAN